MTRMGFKSMVNKVDAQLQTQASTSESMLHADFVVNGFELLQAVKASPEPYDIIFSDQEMPLMNGDEAVLAIKALFDSGSLGWKCPLCLVTGNADSEEEVVQLLAAGASRVVGKPLGVANLHKVLYNYGIVPAIPTT